MPLIFIRIQKFKLNLCNDEFLEDKSMPRNEPKMQDIAAKQWTQLLDVFCTLISCTRNFVAIRFQVRFACDFRIKQLFS
jgi:hypothetical protein